MSPWIPESAFTMVENHNPDINESKPLTTETEVLTPQATADPTGLSSESTSNQVHETAHGASSATQHAPPAAATRASADHGTVATVTAAEGEDDLNYDAADFAAALANFDREQAAESAAAQNLTVEEVIVTGTVVKVTDKHVVVDIGLKSEGLIPLEQVLDINGVSKFKTGDSVEVVVEREEPEGGYLVSYEKALRHKVWDKLEQAANDKTPVKGMVLGRVKGGLTVDIGIKAFLPGSQVEVRPVRNLDGYIGTEIQVRVIKLNKKRGNVVISRKELLEEDQNARKSVTLATLEEGSVLTGTVKNLTDYGAFVDLGGLDGLLHITDMSWGRLTHPRDLVNVGDEIQVKVLKFDKDKQRVSLGFKQLTPDPWLDATDRYPIGAQVRGRILSVTDYGAFVELEQGIEGLVHVSNLSWTKRIKHPSEVLKKGEKVGAIVLGVEPENRRLSLGVKQLQPDVWDTFFAQHRIGDVIKGKILRTAQFGAFVEIAEGVEGLCHVSEAVGPDGKPVAMDVDSEHEFKIVKMNQEEKKVGLSIRAVGEEASRAEVESYKEREKSPKGNNSGSSSSSSSNSSSTTLGDLIKCKRSESEKD